jgi:hypothetical protein
VETVATKHAFKQYGTKHGIRIKTATATTAISQQRLATSLPQRAKEAHLCGVNTHFQNGIAKQPICNLLKSECKQLLHVLTRWPETVHFALWSYTLSNAALLHNSLPVLEDGTSRLDQFVLVAT